MNSSAPQDSPVAAPAKLGVFGRWWRAATEPFYIDEERTIFQQMVRRALLWLPVVLPLVGVLLFGAFQAVTVWRAHTLATEAMESARAGAIAKARMQVMSAANLRPDDLPVRRAEVFVRSKMNDPQVLGQWRELAETVDLTAEEAAEYAMMAVLFGTAEQFEHAHSMLVQAGDAERAASLLSAYEMRSGNIGSSIEGARAAAASGDPARKLSLARLLVARHGPALLTSRDSRPEDVAGAEEAADLIDSLRGTPQAAEALGLGLALLPVSMERARSWAEEAMRNPDPSSSALIPAAQFLFETGTVGSDEMFAKLSPVFAKATADQKAAFGHWLNRVGRSSDTLVLISAADTSDSPHAFAARAMALGNLGQWDALLAMADEQTKVPESLRLAAKALALSRLGRNDLVPALLAEAVAAGAKDRRLKETLRAIDGMDGHFIANDTLLELCGNPELAGEVFPLARDRFARDGQLELRRQAWKSANVAAPQAAVVKDYQRRLELLAGRSVDLRETAAAVNQINPSARFTHALALLREGKAAEAVQIIQEASFRLAELPPGDLAILVAANDAADRKEDAVSVRALIRPGTLDPEEEALLGPGQ